MCLLVSDTLDEDPARTFSAAVNCPSDSRCSLMCTSGKISQTRFTSVSPKCSLGNAAVNRCLHSCVMLAFLISIQPGTSSSVSRCISLSSSLDALLESRDVVSDTLAPVPLELVRGKEHAVVIALSFKPGHQGFDTPTVSVCFSFSVIWDVSCCGQQLLVSHRQTNSSRCSFQATNWSHCN